MKKIMAALVGLGAVAFLLVASGYAQMGEEPQDQQEQRQPQAQQDQFEVTGQVAQASDDNVEIINQQDQFAVPLQIDSEARVMMNGEQIQPSEIPSCAQVEVQYTLEGNQLVAQQITVTPPQRGVGGAGEQTDEQDKKDTLEPQPEDEMTR
ncbi:MAG: hypothetical protein ACOX6T_02680 [Myxococcales bacterium]|jgi:hypothetical protein